MFKSPLGITGCQGLMLARSLAGYANGYCTYHTNGIYTNSKYTQFCRVSQSDSNPKLSAFCNRLVSAKC